MPAEAARGSAEARHHRHELVWGWPGVLLKKSREIALGAEPELVRNGSDALPLQGATPLLDHSFEARARSSAMVARVEFCSGSVRSSSSAARPAARARSNAGANSSLRITRSA